MPAVKPPREWWIFEHPDTRSRDLVYHKNPVWLSPDLVVHVVEHSAIADFAEQQSFLLDNLHADHKRILKLEEALMLIIRRGYPGAVDVAREALEK